jgi:4-coumarate--CoA ligase
MACLASYKERIKFIKTETNVDFLKVLNIAPWFHVVGFVSMYIFACSGNDQMAFLTRFEEKVFYESIEKYKINFLITVPPIMVMMIKSLLFDKYDLSSVKLIACGAAPLSGETEDQVKKKFNNGLIIHQGYGMSETTYGVIGTYQISKPGSVGEPVQGIYVKVIDESGKPLGPNQPGEICFKGDRIMRGYINDEKSTKETIDQDGWLHSGDIGYYDDDHQFFIVDRLKELIKYNGFQVAPAELEGIILTHPKVKDCGVIGIPDDNAGELPFAFVVKQPGVDVKAEEIIKHVQENVSKTKWLYGGVKFVDEIPKNPSGKILRKDMRQMYKNMKSKL